MPTSDARIPSYRRHKPTGQAVVTLSGRDFYLGTWNTKASRAEYDRLVNEWLASGRTLPTAADAGLTVVELVDAYVRWACGYYKQSREVPNIKWSLRPAIKLYGRTPAAKFGPLALKVVRENMIERDWCRKLVNQRIGRVKRCFKWGVENELVPPSVWHGLQAVRGLAPGRSRARETEPVKPVPEAFVDALQPHVAPQVWAMIELQRLTGMRPGEVTIMRTCDIDTTGKVWTYTPAFHKTQHHGHRRQVFLGPRAIEVLRPWLRTDLQAYLFQPVEAVAWQHAQRGLKRTTPLSCGNRPGTNRRAKPEPKPAEVYSVGTYSNAIRRGCVRANVPKWHAHRLRHNAATWLRTEFGLDVARVVLGHRTAAVTELYAELDFGKAREAMAVVG